MLEGTMGDLGVLDRPSKEQNDFPENQTESKDPS